MASVGCKNGYWTSADGHGRWNQQCWSLDERPWKISPIHLPWKLFIRICDLTWIYKVFCVDRDPCTLVPHSEMDSLNGISWGLAWVEPVPILALEAPKHMMDARSEHTYFSGCQIGPRYLEGMLAQWWAGYSLKIGRVFPWLWIKKQQHLFITSSQVRAWNVHWSQHN